MLCETCRWSGRPGFVRAPRQAASDRKDEVHGIGGADMIPCPECGGQGIAHCCDGICEQPDSPGTGAAGDTAT